MTKTKPVAPIPSEIDQAQVIERPDGFYWQDTITGKEYGPYPTLLEALQDMQSQGSDTGYEEGETLEDAEAEIGISEWIDPDTGEPGAGVSPRLADN